ncbi:MAG: DUF4340 domain-containing protein [Bacteroidota bacterium]
MKLTTRNLLIVLVVLGAAYGISQITKRTGRSKSLRAELVVLDTAKVSKVIILSAEGEVVLTEAGEGWQVTLKDGTQKNAKESAVKSLLSSLTTIKPGRLAAKSEDKWQDYAVDSAGTRVQVFEGSDKTNDIVIGRFGMEGQQRFYTFVRLFEDQEVYVANNFMGMSVSKDANSYRENILLQLESDSLSSITYNYPDSSFMITKNEKWFLGEQAVDSTTISDYLRGLDYLSSREFYDAEILSSPSHQVTLAFLNQESITFDAYSTVDGLAVRSSENPEEVFLDETLVKKVFKGPSAFLPTSL